MVHLDAISEAAARKLTADSIRKAAREAHAIHMKSRRASLIRRTKRAAFVALVMLALFLVVATLAETCVR